MNAAQRQAVISLLGALESGHVTLSSEGALLFDVLGGPAAELVFDGVTSGTGAAIDGTIWADDANLDPIEVAKVRIHIQVLS